MEQNQRSVDKTAETQATITIVFSLRMSYNVMYCESVNAFNKK